MPGSRRVVEIDDVIFQRLTRAVRKHATVEPFQSSWKRGLGRFQMALHADLKLTLGMRPRRMDNSRAHGPRRSALPGRCNVVCTRSMAALAIDAFGQLGRK